jgi:hypothetical protein
MKPKPLEALNHFTVPCSFTVQPRIELLLPGRFLKIAAQQLLGDYAPIRLGPSLPTATVSPLNHGRERSGKKQKRNKCYIKSYYK